MRIIHATTFLQGGAGLIILQLALHQRNRGHEVIIFTSKTPETDYCNYPEYLETLKKNAIPCIEVDSTFKRDLYQNMKVVKEIRKLMTELPIDLIHAHAAIPAFIGVLARSGYTDPIPVIQTMHGWGLKKSLAQEDMDVTIMNGLDKVITVSQADKKLLLTKGVAEKKIGVIPNGVERFETIERDIESDPVLEELKNFKKRGFRIIGCIGTVCERKNQLLLIKAFNRLQNKDRLICAFIGEGEGVLGLRKIVQSEGLEDQIKFYGYLGNANKYLKQFDCLILPSRSEGFSLVPLEAFRAEVPVILSDIAVFRELIQDGRTGYLFKSENASALSEKLNEVLSAPKESINQVIQKAHDLFESSYTKDVMTTHYDQLYDSLN